MDGLSTPSLSPLNQAFASLREDLAACVVGQPVLVERLLIALLADGHQYFTGRQV